jgi:hypothetical protein
MLPRLLIVVVCVLIAFTISSEQVTTVQGSGARVVHARLCVQVRPPRRASDGSVVTQQRHVGANAALLILGSSACAGAEGSAADCVNNATITLGEVKLAKLSATCDVPEEIVLSNL